MYLNYYIHEFTVKIAGTHTTAELVNICKACKMISLQNSLSTNRYIWARITDHTSAVLKETNGLKFRRKLELPVAVTLSICILSYSLIDVY